MSERTGTYRAGMAVIVGRANTGKSSFLNRVLGETVSVVSPVAQTTRRSIRGVLTREGWQVVFLDTPGIRAATHRLGALLNRNARAQTAGADAVCLLLDASVAPQDEDRGWMKKLVRDPVRVFALLNKTDLGCKRAAYEKAWAETLEGARSRDAALTPPVLTWHEISAATGDGVEALLEELREAMPEAEAPLVEGDTLTDDPLPYFIADMIRAEYNKHLRSELPHALAVAVESIEDQPDGGARVKATLYVEKATQRPILLGEKGRLLRRVKRAVERELEELFERPHRVEAWIEVEPDWSRNYWLLRKFGYLGN